jgi:hypothetical protein
LVDHTVSPSGVIAIADGSLPTGIGAAAAFVRGPDRVTVPEPWLTTYAVWPSGVIAIAMGSDPTLMVLPAVLVAVLIGVTDPPPLTTYAFFPSGVIAIASGSGPPG